MTLKDLLADMVEQGINITDPDGGYVISKNDIYDIQCCLDDLDTLNILPSNLKPIFSIIKKHPSTEDYCLSRKQASIVISELSTLERVFTMFN